MTQPDPLVLAFGDSLIAGHGLAPEAAFPAQLEARLRARWPGARLVNAGVSGDTTRGALARLPRVLAGLPARPGLAVVQIGPNDVLWGVPPAQTRANLDAIVTELSRCGIAVLLATVAPPAMLAARAAPYVEAQRAVAAAHGVATAPFFPPGVLGHPAMVLADRVHPNAAAIAAVVAGLAPTVERMLGAAPAQAA